MITVQKASLVNAMRVVLQAVPSRATLPCLHNVNIQSSENKLSLTTTDLEKFIHYSIPCKSDETEELSVDARLFSDCVANLDKEIQLELDAPVLFVSSAKQEITLRGMTSDEFPLLPKKGDVSQSFDCQIFKDVIRSVIHAAATDETRPILAGVHFLNDEHLTLSCADGFRMAIHKIAGIENVDFSYVIPANVMEIVAKTIGNSQGTVEMFVLENQIAFCLPGDIWIYAQLLMGNFPNVLSLVPQEYNSRVVIESDYMQRAIKSAMVFGRHNDNLIHIVTNEKEMVISAQDAELGQTNHSITLVNIEGDLLNITVNGQFVQDALSSIDSNVVIEMQSNIHPLVLYPENQKDEHLCVIMPMNQK